MSQRGYDSSGTTEATTRQLAEALEHLNRNFKEKLVIGIGRPTVSTFHQADGEAAKQAQQARQRDALERKRFAAVRAKDDRMENPAYKTDYEHIREKYRKIAGEQILATPLSERTLERIHLIRANAEALAQNEIYILQARAAEDDERRRLRAELTRDMEQELFKSTSLWGKPVTYECSAMSAGAEGVCFTQRLDFSLDSTKLNQKENDMIIGQQNLITPSGRRTVVTQYTEEAHPRRRKDDPAKKLSRVETLEALLAIVQNEAEQWRTKEADKVFELGSGAIRRDAGVSTDEGVPQYRFYLSWSPLNSVRLDVDKQEFLVRLPDVETKPTESALTIHTMAEKSLKELIKYEKKVSK